MKRSRGAAGLDGGQEQGNNAYKADCGALLHPLACITALQDYERQLRVKAPNLPLNKQPNISNVHPSATRDKLSRLVAKLTASDYGRKQQWPSLQLQQTHPPQPATISKELANSRSASTSTSAQRSVSDWDPIAIPLQPAEPCLPVAAVAVEPAARGVAQERCCSGSPSSSPTSSSKRPRNHDQIVPVAEAGAQHIRCPDSPNSSSSSPHSSSGSPEQHQITPDVVDLTLDTDTDTQSDSGSDPRSDSEAGSEIDADICTEIHTESDDDDVQIVDLPAQPAAAAEGEEEEEDPAVSSCTGSDSSSSDQNSGDPQSDIIDKSRTKDQAESTAAAHAAADTAAAAAAAQLVDLPAAAAAFADSSDNSNISAADSDSTETSSDSSCSSSSDDDSGSDGEWTPNKPNQHSSRCRSTDHINRNVARRLTATDSPPPSGTAATCGCSKLAAAAAIVEQVTPPSCSTTATKQQQQHDETPVLTEQQRIKAAADCKSPGTPQLLLLPCCLIGSSSSSGLMSAAAAQQQQQQVERDVNGRRVLGEVQPGQIRGLVTPKSKIKISKQQQQKDATDLQIKESSITVDATPVKTEKQVRGAATAAAAAPSTPEISKVQHTPQQQQHKQQQQEEEDWLDTRQCKDNRQQQQQQFMTPNAVTAAGAAAGRTPLPQRQLAQLVSAHLDGLTAIAAAAAEYSIAAGAMAAASFADKHRSSSSSSSTSAAAVDKHTSSSLLSPLKSPAAVCLKLAPSAAAAAVTPAAAAAPHGAAVVPPLSDCRTMSYVRTPRQPGMFRPAGITKQAVREAAALAYHQAASSAYNSGSNPDWSSSGSSTPPVSRHATVNAFLASLNSSSSSSATKPEGAGHLSTKPTLEQRVQCAYLRMRLTEAAAAGANWAVLDLAGLPLDASEDAVEDCRQKYAAERNVLLKCRSLAQVATEDKRAAAAFCWIKEVRLAAAAAQSRAKQGVLKRISPVSSLPQWQLSKPVARQQQRPRVRFDDEVQEFSSAARAAAEASV